MTLSVSSVRPWQVVLVITLFGVGTWLPAPAYASISTGDSSNLDQLNFRWRQDDGSESAATWRAATNTGITGISGTESDLRIRINIDAPSNRTSIAVQPRLEFSDDATTCTDGTWSTIGAQASASVFRLKASSHFADGDNTTQQIGADTFVTGDIYESSQTGASVTVVGNSESTEIEWAIEANSASAGTTYRFRATDAGTAFGSYTVCATLAIADPVSFSQDDYRWYVDNDGTNPTDPWSSVSGIDIAENTALTALPVSNDPPDSSQELRLRVNFLVNNTALGTSEKQFKLQFKTGTDEDCTTGSWTDVAATAAAAWQFATSSVTDGADITSVLTASDVNEEYAKSNPTQTNHSSATAGQQIEYDFHIIGSGTDFADATTYSFRAVESDATVFDSYLTCPTLTTEPTITNLLRHGNFFASEVEQGFFWAD